jgi:lipopolysaccharide export system protein LptA
MMTRWASRWGAVLLLVLLFPASGQPAAGEAKVAATGQQEKTGSGTSLVDSLSFTSRKEPIHIRSRDLEFRYNEKRVTYRGNVVVIQGETTLKSDTLTVTYEEPATEKDAAQPKIKNTASEKGAAQANVPNTSPQQQLKEIVAEGNVDITSGDRHATAKKAVFTQATQTVVLSGNAVLQEGENRVTGEKVTVYLDEKRTVVDGGEKKSQVEMWVTPQQQEGEKKGEKTP